MQPEQRAIEIGLGVALEVVDLHVADAVAKHPMLDRLDADDVARQHDLPGRTPLAGLVLAADEDGDLRSGLTAKPLDRAVERHVERRFVLDLHDAVPALEPRAGRGRLVHRTNDGEVAFAKRDHDTETTELAAGAGLHLFVDLRAEQGRVRVEGPQHPVDGDVLDFPKLEVVLVLKLVLKEREHLTESAGEVPWACDVSHLEFALRAVDLNLQRFGAVFVVDEDGRDALLNGIEAGEHHPLMIDAARVDIVTVHLVDDPVHHLKLLQVPGGLVASRARAGGRVDVELKAVFDRPAKGNGERREDDHQTKEGFPKSSHSIAWGQGGQGVGSLTSVTSSGFWANWV